jgi:hypothetical protein
MISTVPNHFRLVNLEIFSSKYRLLSLCGFSRFKVVSNWYEFCGELGSPHMFSCRSYTKTSIFQCWQLGSCRSSLRSPYQKDNEQNLSHYFHIVRPSDDGGVDIDCAGDRVFSGPAARSDAPYIHTDRPGCEDFGAKAR